jgi:20S proteasome alpha/beta subunit
MTVCAAAICAQRRAIVMVSDQKVTWGTVANPAGMTKNMEVHPNWIAMVAADDVGHITPICEDVVEVIYPSAIGWQDKHVQDVKKAFVRAVKREGRTSGHIGILQILVGGFDNNHTPHLFVIDGDAHVTTRDRSGQAAIGSGASDVFTSLITQRITVATGLAETMYGVFKAKRAAERDPGVGRPTFVVTLHVDHKRYSLTAEEVSKLRALRNTMAAVKYLNEKVLPKLELKDIVYR